MRIFLTGGTGFVGSHFLRKSMEIGHTVVAQRRPGSVPRIPINDSPIWVDRPLDGDFSKDLDGCDVLVHLAAHTPNPPYALLEECLYWNVFATIRLLQQAVDQGIKDIIIAGTCFEYGLAAEGQEFIHPSTEPRPLLSYPISKAAATTSCLGMARSLGLRLQVLRIFQVFGEGENPSRFWPSLKSAAIQGNDFAMSSGHQIRDFINVTDVVDQLMRAMDFKYIIPAFPIVKNIGTGKPQSLLDFANSCWSEWEATGKLLPGKIEPRSGDFNRLVANIKDIHRV